MDRSQAIDLVSRTLTQSFDEERFTHFIRNLVNHLDESKKQTWTLKKAAFQDYVNHFMRLGTYADPRGERVDVLVIYLRKDTTLARGRVTLRNFVADYMTTGHGQGKAAVIAAFVSPTEDDWRFSFVKLDYTLEKTDLGFVTERAQLTPARRYSYLVGRNENCHTAQKQFLELLQTDHADPTVAALEAAFSVEKVTKEFFEHYRDLFEKSRDALKAFLRTTPNMAKEFEERGITPDDFAKKLLGQIVFLYFLQKKGWFGVERDQRWGQGPKNYLRLIFNDRERLAWPETSRKKRDPNFFNDVLEPLFYDALSNPREADNHFHPLFGCRIPFLNGGLFEPLYGYRWVETEILLPDTLFSNDVLSKEGDSGTGILDVFDRYNFTVNEAEPLEKEVAVDPEMLGKVFENLLPENIRHSSGTYYTPRIIVHYMCQQALLHYLTARATNVPPEDIDVFLRLAERFADFESRKTKAHSDKRLPESIRKNAAVLDELLANITVCDPAIGSGAFPVGMMHEIVRARMALTPELEEQELVQNFKARTPYALKRHAIYHSLYGVDEDPGAVEIAKLRLWLSMVVDEDEIKDIQPLPNLDYKIMQGNSLLEEFDGVRLFDDRHLQQPDAARDEEITWIRQRISEIQQEYIRLHGARRKNSPERVAAEREVKKLQKRLVSLNAPAEGVSGTQGDLIQQGSWSSLTRIQQLHTEFFDEASRTKKDKIRAELDRIEWDFMRATLREQGKGQALIELEKASAKHRKPFFLWKLQFGEVFRKNGGFDIVIANPPYVRHESISSFREPLVRNYETAASRADLFVFFMERGIRLLRDSGAICFICSNKYFRAAYGSKLRDYLTQKTTIRRIIDFGDAPVFNAIAYASIFLATKELSPLGHRIRALTWPGEIAIDDIASQADIRSALLEQTDLKSEGWNFSPLNGRLLSRLQQMGIPLKEYVGGRCYRGIITGLNDAFVIDEETRAALIAEDNKSAELIKPWLRGRDVKRWDLQWAKLYAIVFPFGFHEVIENYPAILKHLTKFEADLRKRGQCVSSRGGGKLGQHHWLELDNNPKPSYLNEFLQPKVIIPAIERECAFAFDDSGYFSNDKTTICVTDEAKFLCGVLNSSVVWWIVQQVAAERQNGYYEFKPMYVNRLPIPKADSSQKLAIERLVECLLWLHKSEAGAETPADGSGVTLLAGYFEQWINALVYELFFPEQLHSAGLYFFRIAEAAKLRPIAEMKGQKLSELRAKFEELYTSNHPLRQGLFALDSIEEVRIIEGKA